MPRIPMGWFLHHIYTAIFLGTALEGLGLPLPAELLFIAAGAGAERGAVSLPLVVVTAAAGNTVGSTVGYLVAYWGGPPLIRRIFRMFGIKDAAISRVEEFFNRYGPTTVFISRFVGFIRAATIYTAGAARMAPWRFVLYVGAGALIWNGIWVAVAYKFGEALPHIMHRLLGRMGAVMVLVLALALVGRFAWNWYRRRHTHET